MNYPTGIKKSYKKVTTYDNRGMTLEEDINITNEYYLKNNIACIYKKPTPIGIVKVDYKNGNDVVIKEAYFKTPSTTDYNGIYKGKYIEFDAKECKNKTSFPLSNIKTHQITHIKNVIRHGGIIFLIIFINNEFYLLKGESLINYINTEERKSLTIDYIKNNAYKINEGYMPRLDYLRIVDKIYLEEKINEEN